ncbi:hypothetical protein [Mucilaginibacter pedocola]|uniref:Addiction module protein n=1 Tax=Mucilaginibacter pedocola TaxID=1792845 RepID=A0A1S9PD13_9SPHI|nr:hypothetical protein [Mucilaginibacter pedocola]OOQ58876.1 hypothetical protein BC343_09540 [Mucilaginibacter pedocola]
MSAAEVQETKTSLIAWIEQLSDLEMLSMLEGVKDLTTHKDWWNDLSSAQRDRLTKSLDNAKKGKTVSSEEFWKRLKNV